MEEAANCVAGSADGCFSPKTCVARVAFTQHAWFRFPKVPKFPGSRQKETERGSKKKRRGDGGREALARRGRPGARDWRLPSGARFPAEFTATVSDKPD